MAIANDSLERPASCELKLMIREREQSPSEISIVLLIKSLFIPGNILKQVSQ